MNMLSSLMRWRASEEALAEKVEVARRAARIEYPYQRRSNPRTAAVLDATFGPVTHRIGQGSPNGSK